MKDPAARAMLQNAMQPDRKPEDPDDEQPNGQPKRRRTNGRGRGRGRSNGTDTGRGRVRGRGRGRGRKATAQASNQPDADASAEPLPGIELTDDDEEGPLGQFTDDDALIVARVWGQLQPSWQVGARAIHTTDLEKAEAVIKEATTQLEAAPLPDGGNAASISTIPR